MSWPETDVGERLRASSESSWQQANDVETKSLPRSISEQTGSTEAWRQEDKVQSLEVELHEQASQIKKAKSDAARWEAQTKEAWVNLAEQTAMVTNLQSDLESLTQTLEMAKEEAANLRLQVAEEERLKTSAQVTGQELEKRLKFWKDKATQLLEDEGLPANAAARRLQNEAQQEKKWREEWQKEAEKWKRMAEEEEELRRLQSERMSSLQEQIHRMSAHRADAEEHMAFNLPVYAVKPSSWRQLGAALRRRKLCSKHSLKIVISLFAIIIILALFCVEDLQVQLRHCKEILQRILHQVRGTKPVQWSR